MRRLPALLGLGPLALACASEVDSPSDATAGTTQALVAIERSTQVGVATSHRSAALAQVVHAPAEADGRAVLALVSGLGALPPLDDCVIVRPAGASASGLGPAELVDVGTVTLESGGISSTLAPHAFPTVTDVVSGVVYTTRDRSPLPEGLEYVLTASGTGFSPPWSASALAPVAPTEAALDGVPVADVATLAPAQPFELSWSPGHADDVIVLRLATADAEPIACAYPGARGTGVVHGEDFAGRGVGRLSIHRVRRVEFAAPGVERGELRFDFDVSVAVTFVDAP